MSENKSEELECEMKGFKLVGSDTITFSVDDGALVKVKVHLSRVGRTKNMRNPDGTPHYAVNSNVIMDIIPPENERVFKIPKPDNSGVKIQKKPQEFIT